jgi:DNA-binding NarL/FixJ family response regulator
MIQIIVISGRKKDRVKINDILSGQNDFKIIGFGSNEYDALKYAMDLKPNIEIIDVEQDEAASLEIALLVKKKSPLTALIILSSHYKNGNASRAFNAGVSGYILKETDLGRLATAIRTVFSGAYYISPPIVEETYNFMLDMEKFPNLRSYVLLVQEGYTAIPDNISRTERQIMAFIASGMTVKEIAEDLHLAPGTVRNYLSAAMQKTNIKTRAQVVIYAFKHGLIDWKAGIRTLEP